jgi:cytochrome c oxidase assembly protein subunit 15
MVEWKPVTGWLPPFGDAGWQAAFDDYRQFPEYRTKNVGMTLAEFKTIYWFEYAHRLWGRLIGVAFVVPFAVFLARRWIDRALVPQLAAVLVLGALQGALGWYMVQSGLVERPDVSQYRLTAHLAAAVAIYGYLFWLGLSLLGRGDPGAARDIAGLRRFTVVAIGWVFVTILSGGFVAGLDAGLTYNTFPLMDGKLVPDGLGTLSPWYLNPFENVTTAQFDHRVLAVTLVAAVIVLWLWSMRALLSPAQRFAYNALGTMALIQLGLGIATLLAAVPVVLGALHQAGALILFSLALWAYREAKPI